MSWSQVHQHVKAHNPGMVLMLGDLHYGGHAYLSSGEFKYAVHEVMKSETMRELYT